MRRTLLTLAASAAAAATVLALAPTGPNPSPDSAEDQSPARRLVDDGGQGTRYYYEEIAVTPANDKEAHVPIWFTLSIGGAEAA